MSEYTTLANVPAQKPSRLGKIGLGVKAVSKNGKEYPREVDFFVLKDANRVQSGACRQIIEHYYRLPEGHPDKIDGETGRKWRDGESGPSILPVMFTSEDLADVIPAAFEAWRGGGAGKKGVKIFKGDGNTGERRTEDGAWEEHPNPEEMTREGGDAKMVARLTFMMPDVTFAGHWQIETGSKVSVFSLLTDIEQIRGFVGRISFLYDLERGSMIHLRREEWQKTGVGEKPHYRVKAELAPWANAAYLIRMNDGAVKQIGAEKRLALPESIAEPDEMPRSHGSDRLTDGSVEQPTPEDRIEGHEPEPPKSTDPWAGEDDAAEGDFEVEDEEPESKPEAGEAPETPPEEPKGDLWDEVAATAAATAAAYADPAIQEAVAKSGATPQQVDELFQEILKHADTITVDAFNELAGLPV